MTDGDRPVPEQDAAADEAPMPAAAAAGAAETDAPAAPVKPAKTPTNWWSEAKAIFWLILAVLGFHSFIAKPFYIPSESMMPVLLKGDRLVVTKYPYGWSWVSPSFHIMPESSGRLFGSLPERGDIVIVTPPGGNSDYIKRVIGLPGDTIEMIQGQLILNGSAIPRQRREPVMLPVDANLPCDNDLAPFRVQGPDGGLFCRLPIVRETLPNGRWYDTIDLGDTPADDFALERIPEDHVWLMGDNRDQSADSRAPLNQHGLGGAVPWANIGGRAEFITFSLDGTSQYLNPFSWFGAFRGGRAGSSLHARSVEQQP